MTYNVMDTFAEVFQLIFSDQVLVPAAIISFLIFLGGCIYQVVHYFRNR